MKLQSAKNEDEDLAFHKNDEAAEDEYREPIG